MLRNMMFVDVRCFLNWKMEILTAHFISVAVQPRFDVLMWEWRNDISENTAARGKEIYAERGDGVNCDFI